MCKSLHILNRTDIFKLVHQRIFCLVYTRLPAFRHKNFDWLNGEADVLLDSYTGGETLMAGGAACVHWSFIFPIVLFTFFSFLFLKVLYIHWHESFKGYINLVLQHLLTCIQFYSMLIHILLNSIIPLSFIPSHAEWLAYCLLDF